MKKMLFAGASMIAGLVLAHAAAAATVEVYVDGTAIGQESKAPVTQTGSAVAAAIGTVHDTADVAATAVNANNMADVTKDLAPADASASASGSLGVSANGSDYAIGNQAAAEAANGAVGGSFFNPPANFAEAANESSAWNNGDTWAGALNANFSTTLPSMAETASMTQVSQISDSTVTQTGFSLAGSGSVFNTSSLKATTANLNNNASVTVTIK